MKTSFLLATLWLGASLSTVFAQPANPVLGGTRVTGDTFRFNITGADTFQCVVQIGTNSGANIVWRDAAPANSTFSTAVVKDGRPRHFRVRCSGGMGGGSVYSVNAATYCWLQPPPGFAMLSFPLETVGNTLSNLLPNVSEGTLLHWQNNALAQMETAQFQFGQWSNPDWPIPRGRAVMLWSPPGANAITLHGIFSPGTSTNATVVGLNLLAPWWPVDSGVPAQPCSDRVALELIGTDGIDPVYRAYTEVGGAWYDPQFNEFPPPFRAFGGLWLQTCAQVWTQTRIFPANDLKAKNYSATSAAKGSWPSIVYFNNYVPGFGIDARLVHPSGTVPAGSNWLAELYGGEPGTPENNLVAAIGGALPFLSGDQVGYLDTKNGGARILTEAPSYSNAVAQIRFWDVRTGATYDTATLKANSPLFLVPTRPPAAVPPVPLLGLISPRISVSRQLLPSAAHLTVEGYRGMSYQVEASSTLSNWTVVATVTNTAATSTFARAGLETNQHEFYRATIHKPAP